MSAKLTTVVLACVLFSACGGSSSPNFDSSEATPPDGQASQPTPTPAPEDPDPEPSEPPVTAPTPSPTQPTPTPIVTAPTPTPVVTTPITTPTPTPVVNTPTPTPVVNNPTPTPEPTTPPPATVTPTPTPQTPTPTPDPVVEKVSASVSWNIPDQRENGDPLALGEIGGYEIMFRKAGELVYETVIVSDQTISEYLLENLDAGQYEFLVAVFDTEGLYSDFSDPVVVNL